MLGQALFKTPIRGEHVYGVSALRHTLGQGAHFYRRAAEFQERSVGFGDVQDSHCSRRIFFSVLAKTLKRNSCSTRWLPRAPISRARAGSDSSVSIAVESCGASPCCTRYPVTPSIITSGAPP